MGRTFLHIRSFVKELPPIQLYKLTQRKKRLVNSDIDAAINHYCREAISKDRRNFLASDMKEKATIYGFSYSEYFLLRLWERTESELNELISDWEHVKLTEKMNKPWNQYIFDDKSASFQRFGKYYNRDCVFAESSPQGGETVRSFINKYGSCIFKPIEKAGGQGIEILYRNDREKIELAIVELVNRYKYGVVVEELISQSHEMSTLHSTSVNTVRIPTIRVNAEKTIVFHPFLRVGRGNSHVDNAGSGGIICALDSETGIVIATGDELGNHYESHPESGKKLIGFQVPRWNEAKKLAIELAQIIPSNRYTGWDLALTDTGWIMVEANARGQFVWQYATLQGCRSEINALFTQMNIR